MLLRDTRCHQGKHVKFVFSKKCEIINFVAANFRVWRYLTCSWTLEFVDFKLNAIFVKWVRVRVRVKVKVKFFVGIVDCPTHEIHENKCPIYYIIDFTVHSLVRTLEYEQTKHWPISTFDPVNLWHLHVCDCFMRHFVSHLAKLYFNPPNNGDVWVQINTILTTLDLHLDDLPLSLTKLV